MFFLDATCPLVSKVHRRGPAPLRRRARDRADRPRGPSGGGGDARPLPTGVITLIETVADAKVFAPTRSGQRGLRHPDHPLGRRHPRASSMCCSAGFPAITTPHSRVHLLRHHQPPGGGQKRWPRAATSCWWWDASTRPTRCGYRQRSRRRDRALPMTRLA